MRFFGQGTTCAILALLMGAGLFTTVARAADLGRSGVILGSDSAPLVRYDAYGYPVYAAASAHSIAPFGGSPACPVGLQPTYDASGNFAGYGPIRICQ
jgi:hypothetical protein